MEPFKAVYRDPSILGIGSFHLYLIIVEADEGRLEHGMHASALNSNEQCAFTGYIVVYACICGFIILIYSYLDQSVE